MSPFRSLRLSIAALSSLAMACGAPKPTTPGPLAANVSPLSGAHSCADLLRADPRASEGLHALAVGGVTVTLYCADMASGAPREYLPLSRTDDGHNFSHYGAGPNSPRGLMTRYSKVRLLPQSLSVDLTDTTFATTDGGTVSFGKSTIAIWPYANAGDCVGDGSRTGTANVDLTGTPFAVALNQFAAQGWHPAGDVVYSPNRQIVSLLGGGYCGSMTTPQIQIPDRLVLEPLKLELVDRSIPVVVDSALTTGRP